MKQLKLEKILEDKEFKNCYYCKEAHLKNRLVNYYMICNYDFKEIALQDLLDFNDEYLIKNVHDRFACRTGKQDKTYCKNWNKQFKKFINYNDK